jgi:colanic acid/amylovoran biosynthesis glycosyltransferase
MSGREASGSRPTVAHLLDCWLSISEVFIYELVRSLPAVRSIIVARQLANLHLFPFSPVHHVNGRGRIEGFLERALGWPSNDLLRAEEYLRRESPRLLHAHFGLLGVKTRELAKYLGLPLITSFYGVDASKQAVDPAHREGFARLFLEGELFLAEGSAMRERLARLGCPREKIRIQHLGVDLARFTCRERKPPEAGAPLRVLFCGRFVEKKGLPDALAAVRQALDAGCPIAFRIVGGGPLQAEIERLIAEHSLAPHVTLAGILDHASYRRELEVAHVLLQPSRTARDGDTEGGAPTVLLEAQAAGLPVVSTTHADIPEYVSDGKSGILVDEGDVTGLARALEELARKPALLGKMGKEGRLHVEKNYDIGREARALERIYEEVLS